MSEVYVAKGVAERLEFQRKVEQSRNRRIAIRNKNPYHIHVSYKKRETDEENLSVEYAQELS